MFLRTIAESISILARFRVSSFSLNIFLFDWYRSLFNSGFFYYNFIHIIIRCRFRNLKIPFFILAFYFGDLQFFGHSCFIGFEIANDDAFFISCCFIK